MTRRSVLQGVAALCGFRLARAQDQPTFSTEVKVVNVLATVRSAEIDSPRTCGITASFT